MLYVILILAALIVGAAGVYCEYQLTRQKNKLLGLIPPAALFLITLFTALIMLAAKAKGTTIIAVVLICYIPILASIISYIVMRRRYLHHRSDEQARQNLIAAQRKLEAERRHRLSEQLRHFACADSGLSAQQQQDIVAKSITGKSVKSISETAGVPEEEVSAIIKAFERYSATYDSVDNSSDVILTPEQEEEIVLRIVNSFPRRENIGRDELWSRADVRELMCNVTGAGVSRRSTSAYLRHFGLTVPPAQAIKTRKELPDVNNWLKEHLPTIRKRALETGSRILWIYQVDVSRVRDFTLVSVQEPEMLCAVSDDGEMTFGIYPKSASDKFYDFSSKLVKQLGGGIVAVLNENFREQMRTLGNSRRESMSSEIEFFGMD